jgi:hypothetical protein
MNELIPQMDAASYHNSAGISKHGLDLIRHAPALYLHRKENPEEQTPAMRWGTLAHTVILEPDKFDDEVYVLPPCDRRTKEGKETYAQAMREAAGRTVITLDDAKQLEGMKNAFYADKACRNTLHDLEHIEASCYWIDKTQDVQCRARPDAIRKDGVVIDYKTTDNASPSAFLRSVMNFRYHVQAAYYLDGIKAITGNDGTFIFIAQEKKPPYLSCVYIVGQDMIEQGRKEYQQDLATYKTCMETGDWSGISSHPLELNLPRWMSKAEPETIDF